MCRPDDFPPYGLTTPDPDAVPSWFRTLDPSEEARFRSWARENWTPGQSINPLWHPVIRDECEAMTTEAFVASAERDPNP